MTKRIAKKVFRRAAESGSRPGYKLSTLRRARYAVRAIMVEHRGPLSERGRRGRWDPRRPSKKTRAERLANLYGAQQALINAGLVDEIGYIS